MVIENHAKNKMYIFFIFIALYFILIRYLIFIPQYFFSKFSVAIKMESEGPTISTFSDSKHVSDILKILHGQRPIAKLCDVILKVSGKIIYAHSNVLCAASPYFDALFCGGQDLPRAFSQKTPQIIEIHIDGDEKDGYVDAVQRVVDFMYTSSIDIYWEILSQVMEIAKIMQMENILGRYSDLY